MAVKARSVAATESGADSAERAKRGAFYTPMELARRVTADALARIRQTIATDEPPIVCDPACGDGVFLEAARDWLATVAQFWFYFSECEARQLAETQMIGVDVDAGACEAARKRLPGARIIQGDFLLDVDTADWPRIHAFVGNPPFLGGNKISGTLGDSYRKRLVERYGKAGNADLCAFFVLRAAQIIEADPARCGLIGFIATNTIAQGDTRQLALRPLVAERGWQIYDADRSFPWPGDAAVRVSKVCLGWGWRAPT